jgi:hypothetical protein
METKEPNVLATLVQNSNTKETDGRHPKIIMDDPYTVFPPLVHI